MNGFVFAISLNKSHGASVGMVALALELGRRGREVVIVADHVPRSGWDELTSAHIPIQRWPSSRPIHLRDAVMLAKTIRRMRPRCILATFGAVNICMAVGFLTRVPVRVSWCQTLTSQIATDWSSARSLRLLMFRKRLFYAMATHLVPLSEAASRDLQEHFHVSSKKCSVLPYGLKDRWSQGLSRRLKGPSEVPTVLCVCRMNLSKGPQLLVEAAGILQQRGVQCAIRLGGTGPILSDLQRRAEELNVAHMCTFIGWVKYPQLEQELAEADLLVVPSVEEAFGLMILEGMAASLPVVGFRTGAVAEFIDHGKQGLLAEGKSAEELADAVHELLQHGSLRQALGQSARERFLQDFEENVLTRRHADWLDSL